MHEEENIWARPNSCVPVSKKQCMPKELETVVKKLKQWCTGFLTGCKENMFYYKNN